MSEETDKQILEVLREIRAGQREVLQAMAEHRALVQEQMRRSVVQSQRVHQNIL